MKPPVSNRPQSDIGAGSPAVYTPILEELADVRYELRELKGQLIHVASQLQRVKPFEETIRMLDVAVQTSRQTLQEVQAVVNETLVLSRDQFEQIHKRFGGQNKRGDHLVKMLETITNSVTMAQDTLGGMAADLTALSPDEDSDLRENLALILDHLTASAPSAPPPPITEIPPAGPESPVKAPGGSDRPPAPPRPPKPPQAAPEPTQEVFIEQIEPWVDLGRLTWSLNFAWRPGEMVPPVNWDWTDEKSGRPYHEACRIIAYMIHSMGYEPIQIQRRLAELFAKNNISQSIPSPPVYTNIARFTVRWKNHQDDHWTPGVRIGISRAIVALARDLVDDGFEVYGFGVAPVGPANPNLEGLGLNWNDYRFDPRRPPC